VALATSALAAPVEVALTAEGRPAATLVLAVDAPHAAVFAAQEFQEHLRRITGTVLPVVTDTQAVAGTRVLIGESAATRALGLKSADFAPQEYLIGFRPGTLVLMGRDRALAPPSSVAASGTPATVEGRFGRALRFDGKAALRAEAPGFSDAAGSLECWARLPEGPFPGGAGTLLRLDGSDPWTYHIVETIGGTRRVRYVTYDGAAGTEVRSGDLAPGWHHLAATHDATRHEIELWVDGVSQGTAPFTRSTCERAPLLIGGLLTGGPDKPVGNPFVGDLDEILVRTVAAVPSPEALAAGPAADPATVLLLRLDEAAGPPRDASGRLRLVPVPGVFDEQGTCTAVYGFLERFCGVRWFAPGEVGLVCPSSATLTVRGEEVRRRPVFGFRQGPYMPVYGMLKEVWGDPSGDDVRRYACRLRLGGQPYAANHSFYGYYDRFYERDPEHPELFEAAHPDWFAQGYTGKPPQMCFTHPGFIQQVVQDARDFFDGKGAKPGAQASGDFFALVPMDNSAWCKCPACQAKLDPAEQANPHFSNGIASDYVFGFANEVAKQIRTSHPGKTLATLAYSSYAYYPKTIRLESNIAVQLCLHVRNWWAPDMERNDTAFYESWVTKEKDRPIYLWLYYCFPEEIAMNSGWSCFPGFFAHTLDRQFKRFAKDGIRGAFLNNLGDYLDTYLTFRFLDDPSQDVDRLIDEFHTLYYGPAAAPMKQLYLRIEETFSNPANYPEDIRTGKRHSHQTEEMAWGYLGTEARMVEFARLVEEAKRLAQSDLQKQRVALFEKGIWEPMVEGRRKYVAKTVLAPEVQALKDKGPASARVPRLPDAAAAGDAARVDWSKAAVLGGWRTLQGYPTARKPEARVAHDGRFLYLQLTEPVAPASLRAEPDIWSGDDWELFFARQRAKPYRQIGANPKGVFADLSTGDGDPMPPSNVKVTSDTRQPERWTVTLAIPLETLLPGGLKPGDTFCANIFRATGGQPRELLAWSPNFPDRFHEPARLGELVLE